MAANNVEDFTPYRPGEKDPNMVKEVSLYWLNKWWIPFDGVKPPDTDLFANLKVFYVFQVEEDVPRGRYVQIVSCGKTLKESLVLGKGRKGHWYVNKGPPRQLE
jgi:hypothetical protein